MNAMVFSAPPLSDPRLTLTRRGRLVFLGIPAILTAAMMLFALLAIALGSVASPAQASVNYPAVDMADYAATVTVLQGDSLWSIAAATDPTRDVRDVVLEIVALNDLGSGVVQAGQQLFVPLPK
ncbi:LysM peptidoglycan-binding domain-containing protein [Arthrobacter psychrolactophilus]